MFVYVKKLCLMLSYVVLYELVESVEDEVMIGSLICVNLVVVVVGGGGVVEVDDYCVVCVCICMMDGRVIKVVVDCGCCRLQICVQVCFEAHPKLRDACDVLAVSDAIETGNRIHAKFVIMCMCACMYLLRYEFE